MTDSLLTIVIPTFERSKSLNLTVNYLLQFSDFKLIVLDGSPFPNKQLFCTANSKLDYRHTPNLSILDRIQYSLQLIGTPYVQLQPDDDFMLIDSSRICLKQLISDSSTSTCIGSCYSFKSLWPSVCYLPEYTSPAYSSICSASISNRLYKSIVNYAPSTIYSVQRTSVYDLWINCLISIQDIEIINPLNPYLSEHLHSLFAHILGSSVVLPITHWFRSENNNPITAQGFSRKIPFHTWLMKDSSRITLLSEKIVSTLDVYYGSSQSYQYSDLGPTIDDCLQQFALKNMTLARSTFASKLRKLFFFGNSNLLLETFQDRLRRYLRHSFFVSRLLVSPLTLDKLLAKTETSSIEHDYLMKSFASQ